MISLLHIALIYLYGTLTAFILIGKEAPVNQFVTVKEPTWMLWVVFGWFTVGFVGAWFYIETFKVN